MSKQIRLALNLNNGLNYFPYIKLFNHNNKVYLIVYLIVVDFRNRD